MLISNMELLPGRRVVEHLGLVQEFGTRQACRARHHGGLKNLFGGELKGYTELLQESREEAMLRMQQQAEAVGANAILNVRFSTSSVAQGRRKIYVYGTAVVWNRWACFDLLLLLVPLALGCGFGQVAERRHYRSIVGARPRLNALPAIASHHPPTEPHYRHTLVTGSTVISVDYFKRFSGRAASTSSAVASPLTSHCSTAPAVSHCCA